MSFLMSLYIAVLFFVLVPGVLVTLPPGGKKLTAALVHAVVFALVYQLTHKAVNNLLAPYEPFEDALKAKGVMCKAPTDCQSNTCTNGMCA